MMTDTPWHQQKRHFRALRDALASEGFEVLRVWRGRHLRLSVRRHGIDGSITLSSSPRVPEHAVNVTMQQARRACSAVRQADEHPTKPVVQRAFRRLIAPG